MQKINLPVDIHLNEIIESFNFYDNLIITAPPGSGKTTRIPASLCSKFKKIIVVVPKRIAAISAAARIADENNWILGNQVGYQIRFENKSNFNTKLIFMTEGVFIKKLQDQKLWLDLELIIFDEFHERSSLLDLALGFTFEKQILEQKIKMIIMSATLETNHLKIYLSSDAKGDAINYKHIHIPTQTYPLEILKSKKSQRLIVDHQFIEHLITTLHTAFIKSHKDILIFMPGISEINFVKKQLSSKFQNVPIDILHGSIKLEEQKKILLYNSEQNQPRRIILSTNIAESSLTLPSIDCVIDSGLVKKTVTENKIGFKKLEISRISLFSATQRAGRAARIGPGVCFQLWHTLDERSMPSSVPPEILSSDLMEECLTLLSLGVRNPDQFSWLDKPQKSFHQALELLHKWELVETEKGQLVQSCPLDIERSLLFVELCLQGLQGKASQLLAFLETTNFDFQTDTVDLGNLKLNDNGFKIEAQLNHIKISPISNSDKTLKEIIISLFFKYFPNKIAKKKEKNFAISSLGRGVELSPYLISAESEYFLLLSGRDYTQALTKCDFAISLTNQEFEKFSSQNIHKTTLIDLDIEKMKLFKIEKNTAGNFVISTTSKIFIDEYSNPEIFKEYFKNNFLKLLELHQDYKTYLIKVNFLKNNTQNDFEYFNNIHLHIFEAISETCTTIFDFFKTNLYEIILYATPSDVVKQLQQLPSHFSLPNGKSVLIDYESEQAPKISARIQDFFGQTNNPTLLNGSIRLTIELLAPNNRPTQITSQLENFWKTSYFEIKKELKSRYPKHAWPDDPINYKPLSKINIKK